MVHKKSHSVVYGDQANRIKRNGYIVLGGVTYVSFGTAKTIKQASELCDKSKADHLVNFGPECKQYHHSFICKVGSVYLALSTPWEKDQRL